MPSCENCPNTDGPHCPSEGSDEAPILIVSDVHSSQSLREGRCFAGGDGKILFDVVGADVRLFRKDCKIVHLVNCQPLGKKGSATDAQIAACAERFDREMDSSHATVAIALGRDAFARLTGIERGGIENRRGYIYSPEDCLPVQQRTRAVIGSYKRDGKHGKAGDPRYGYVTVERRPALPASLKWIVPTLGLRTIMSEGLKTIPCLKADCARAVRLACAETQPVVLTMQTTIPKEWE